MAVSTIDTKPRFVKHEETVTFDSKGIGYLTEVSDSDIIVSVSTNSYPCTLGRYNNKYFLIAIDTVSGNIVPHSGNMLVRYWSVEY